MKKIFVMAVAAALMCGCEKAIVPDESVNESKWGGVDSDSSPTKRFTFTVKGDFGSATFTRGYLNADGQDMTDLWVFDYMDGQCVQSVHQERATAGDDWGQPQMSLKYGSHHVYFVASRGGEPSVDEDGHTISWGSPRDTFWKDYEVSVVNTSNGNRAVTLERVATKLKITVNDVVPASVATMTVTPERWYYGLDYVSGDAVSAQRKDRSIDVPSSYIGTSGQLSLSIFGLSGASEWTTNVSMTAKDGDGNVLGSATIAGAPFKRNRSTEYGGSLFGSGGALDLSLNGEWEQSETGTW